MSRFDFLQCNRLLSSFYPHADEAESLYLEGRYELSAFKSRKALDLVVQWLSQRYYGGEEQLNLKALVDGLNRQNSFSSQEYSALLTIVNIGNKAVHSDASISKNEANTALKSLHLFLRELNNTYKNYQSSASQGSMEDIEAYFLSSEVEEKPAPKAKQRVKRAPKPVTEIDESNPQELLTLGMRYYKGDGVIRDMKQVVKYWTLAANMDYPEAQFALAGFYEGDYGGRQSYPLAGQWYQRAAGLGHVGAQYRLGLFLENGWGMKRDYKEAKEWYARAAGKNHADALYRLGLIYERGYKLKADTEKAQKYFKRAAALGQAEAQAALAKYLPPEQPRTLEPSKRAVKAQQLVQPTSAQLQQAEQLFLQGQECFYRDDSPENLRQAFNLYLQAAGLGYGPAQEAVANCYYHGWGMKNKRYKDAVQWYTRAGDQNQAEAQYQLAECLTFGQGCKRDLQQAANWYARAAEQGHGKALYKLGLCYEEGKGVEQDMERALELYRQAGQQQGEYSCTGLVDYQEKVHFIELYNLVAQEQATAEELYQLGRCYQDANGVAKNLAQAVTLYTRAGEQDHREAQYQLGILYELGRGVKHDLSQSVHWYQEAANNGHEEARWKLLNWFQNNNMEMDSKLLRVIQGKEKLK